MGAGPLAQHDGNYLKLALVGEDSQALQELEEFLYRAARSLVKVTPLQEADVDLVDLEGGFSWELYQKIQTRPCIALSHQKISGTSAIWVPKPLQQARLLSALQQVRRFLPGDASSGFEHSSLSRAYKDPARAFSKAELARAADKILMGGACEHLCGQRTDSDYRNSGSSRGRAFHYDDQSSLHRWLDQAIGFARESGSNIEIEGLGVRLLVLAGGKYVYLPMPMEAFEVMCARKCTEDQLSLRVSGVDFMVDDNSQEVIRADQLLWHCGLACSKGTLPEGDSMVEPVQLVSWPNFTRLTTTPFAIQIVAQWSRSPISVEDTARRLGIPLRYVVAVYSACKAMGLLRPSLGSALFVKKRKPGANVRFKQALTKILERS